MLDLTAVRMFHLYRVADEPFTLEDEKTLTRVVLDYAYQRSGRNKEDGLHLSEDETDYVLNTFGYEVNALQLTKRQFLSNLLPHWSEFATRHPQLVGSVFRALVDPVYAQALAAKFPNLNMQPK